MGPSDEISFLCPQCGTPNRPGGKTACFLCGQRLDNGRPETGTGAPISPAAPAFRDAFNPYAAPPDFVSPAFTFKISSLLLVVAVIAVCLGVAHENLMLGIVLAVAVTPALVFTFVVAARRKARGRPMAIFEKVGSFLGAIVGVAMIAVSAVIAFFVSCSAGSTEITALVIGGTAAVATAAFITYCFLFMIGRRGGSPRKS